MKHHKTLRRGFSVLLSLVMCLSLMPTVVMAEGTDTGKAIQLGTTQIEGSQDGSVYFGNYKQSSNGSGIFNNDPIKWRVMSNKDGKLFLLADQNLDVKPYNNSNTSITWEKSTIRSWLNGYGASENNSGTDYSSNNFIGTAFSGKEQGAIAETSVYNATQSDGRSEPNPFHLSISGGNNTTDKIFLLSIEEADKSSIALRKSTNTAYVANYSNMQAAGEADCWWLRSPGRLEDYAAFVATDGGVRYSGSEVDSTSFAVRPTFNLNLNAVLFTSAAVSGKSASGMDSGLTAVGNYTGSEWKLTLKDENRSEFTATTKTVASNKVTIEYSNAETGENEYISAILKDEDGNVNYYGRIAQLDGTTHGDSGTAEINLSGIDMTGKTLCVFNEQYNGDKKTDYASDFCPVNVTTYTISFDANGGSGSMTAGTIVPGSYTLPECGFDAPQGQQFAGWATSKSGEVISDTTITVTEDTTLYAIWGINYGVTVNGVKVTSLNKDNVIVGKKVQYDPATKTISVKDFVAGDLIVTGDGETIVNISNDLGAPAVGALTVTGAKDVTVTANSGAPAILNEADITCTGNVTITNSNGMAVSNNLTVTGAQDVTVEGYGDQAIAGITDITCTGNVTITNSKGMAVSNPLTVNSAKDVTVTANTSTAPAIAGTADITCTGKVEITNSTGMAVNSGLTVKNAKDVTVTANTASPAISGTTNITCTGKVEITNSTGMAVSDGLTVKSAKDVTVTANTANADYPAIGGTVDITCSGKVDITNKAGMAVSGALTVKSAKDVTVTANTENNKDTDYPAIAGTADITCTGDVIIANSTGKAVYGSLTYQRASDHGYTVKTGPSLDNLDEYEVKEAGQVFNETLDASAVKISVGHTSDEWQNSSTQHWQVCTDCGDEFNRTDHTFSGRTCTVCGYTKPSAGVSSSPDYSVTVDDTVNGTVTVSPKSVKQGDTVTITVTPDEGYTLETLTALDKNGKEIKLTDNGSGKYTFEMPASKVTVKASFKKATAVNPFVDVKSGDYFYDAVLWAVERGITSGTSETTFSPNEPCTRAQIVTFLWRAAGSPQAKNAASFSDVAADAYYAKAVAWAVENGITSGTGDGKFSPDATCTRAQAVTFLSRALKGKAASGSTFSDVAADSYYAEAVAWAVANDITKGTSAATFSPEEDCTRGQIVTFLFRAMAE